MEKPNRHSWPVPCNQSSNPNGVVDTALNVIENDGPIPMWKRKPAKRIQTAADKFKNSHEAQYRARSAKSEDRVERVCSHNATCPKMKDELDKRRSTTRVVVRDKTNKQETGNVSKTNVKGTRNRSRGRRIRHRRKRKSRPEERYTRKSIAKPRSRRKESRMYSTGVTKCRCRGPLYRIAPNWAKKKSGGTTLRIDVDEPMCECSVKSEKSESDYKMDTQNPNTSTESISTYASYASSNEPMV